MATTVASPEASADPRPSRPVLPPSWQERLFPPMPAGGWRGWIGPLFALLVAAAIRVPSLGRPRDFAFDETYYAKDALSLLRYGVERAFLPDANSIILANGDPWTVQPFRDEPAYVVHPPFGKWVIAAGEAVFGVTPTGWRVGVLICGLLAVVVLARIVRRFLRSNLWGTVAGLLMAIDGLAIVTSRTAVLDGVLMITVLGAFGALLIDRDRTRRRVASLLPDGVDPTSLWGGNGAPIPWLRSWRVVAALLLGLACGVKWSGIWYVAAFGLLTVVWDVGLRRTTGCTRPWRATLAPAVLTAAVWVGVAGAVYVTTWAGWFLTDAGYYRDWAAKAGSSVPWVPEALRSLWHYHAEAMRFHTSLTTPHSYSANAWGWPVLARPTSFFYSETAPCGADRCSQEVLALGNPLIWWAATASLFYAAWRWVGRRDWRSGAILAGFLAGWAPWLLFQERTVFSFYGIVFLPFMIMSLTMALAAVRGAADRDPVRLAARFPNVPVLSAHSRDVAGVVAVAGFLVLAIALTWWFLPIWTGVPIPYSAWNWRMWFPSWV